MLDAAGASVTRFYAALQPATSRGDAACRASRRVQKKTAQRKKHAQFRQCDGHCPCSRARFVGTWTLMPLRAARR
jgi:hypothetical protein